MELKDPDSAELLARLSEGKMIQLAPQGISMLPFIYGGRDKVLIKKMGDVRIGDIVLAPYNGQLILHRVYEINGNGLTLMGDGNLKGTEQVDKSEVWGAVVEIVKPRGRCRKPHKAWLWRHTLPLRRIMLKVQRKWNKLWNRELDYNH